MLRLEKKVIIVTGSTTGIGKAIALRCAAEGASVVITGLEEEWGKAVVQEIGQQHSILHDDAPEHYDQALPRRFAPELPIFWRLFHLVSVHTLVYHTRNFYITT